MELDIKNSPYGRLLSGPANRADEGQAILLRPSFICDRLRCVVDVLSDLLHRARVRNAIVRKLIQAPPWSYYLADPEPLTAVAALEGSLTIVLHNAFARAAAAPGAPSTHTLAAGDIALIKGGEYTIADSPATPCQVVVRNGHKYATSAADGGAAVDQMIAPRTFGDHQPGAITMLHGIYELHGRAGDRLLELLPAIATVPAGPRTRPLLEMLSAEAARDEPGQDAVLQRILDLILVVALRSWGTNNESRTLGWLGAIGDPAIGRALAMLHADHQYRWTTATLAKKVGMSRAAFCARFTSLVGEPPMAYLIGWRMTLAADKLRSTDATVAAVAREVGYDNAFSFSTAFKRAYRQSPTEWRRGTTNADVNGEPLPQG
jgi:AraC-like DNA-binding protein